MFTGIIEQIGKVVAIEAQGASARLSVQAYWPDLKTGESISVNGVCLTLLPFGDGLLQFDISPETLYLTGLGQLKSGDSVNLERAIQAHARFGGHYVTGHVDATAMVTHIRQADDCIEFQVGDFERPAMRHLLPKGSIALDGVSLTINTVDENSISLMLIPHTLAHTTFSSIQAGQRLNVEFDYFTRIMVHQLEWAGLLKNEVL